MMEARHLAQFAGYTSRVSELLDVLDDVNNGRYERTMVDDDGKAGKEKIITAQKNVVTQSDLKGTVVYQDYVRFFFFKKQTIFFFNVF